MNLRAQWEWLKVQRHDLCQKQKTKSIALLEVLTDDLCRCTLQWYNHCSMDCSKQAYVYVCVCMCVVGLAIHSHKRGGTASEQRQPWTLVTVLKGRKSNKNFCEIEVLVFSGYI